MLTQERLKQLLDYDPVTGRLIWKTRTSNRIKVGDPVGSMRPDGYLDTSVLGKRHLVHRLIYLWHHGYMPEEIDHINRKRSDNRIENLRDAGVQNQHNRGSHPRNTSGIKGVYWDTSRGKWHAQICTDYRVKFLGRFTNLSEAGAAVRAARVDYHGEFASHE